MNAVAFYFDQLELKRCLLSFRKLIIENLPATLHPAIKRYPEPRLRKLMDLLKDRLRLPSDLANQAYFFTAPVFEDSRQLLKPLAKDQATPDRANKILTLLES